MSLRWALVMIYMPSFIKTGSGIEKIDKRDIQRHRQQGDLIRLKRYNCVPVLN
jgi:hypothetical protein